jgi:SAM-dependent methyltransferase
MIIETIKAIGIKILFFPENLLSNRARESLNPESRGIAKFLHAALPSASKDQIALDVGAGSKKWQLHLENKGFTYKSCDIEHPFSPHDAGLHDYVGNVEDLPIDQNTFDFVLCTQVLEHVSNPNLALKEINRVLKLGGNLLLTTNFIYGLHGKPYDYFRFSRFGLSELFAKNGFRIYKLEARGGYFGILAQYFFELPNDLLNLVTHGTTTPDLTQPPKFTFSTVMIWLVFVLPFFAIKFISWVLSACFQIIDNFNKSEKYALGYGVLAQKVSQSQENAKDVGLF